MTMTLAHPAAEELGRFVEGTLDDAGRAAIVAHVADCDECRMAVVDTAEFVAPAVEHSDRRRWLAAAAAILVVVGGTFVWHTSRDPLTPVIELSSHLRSRSVAGRLTGFTYVERINNRGSGDEENVDSAQLLLDGALGRVLDRRDTDPRTLHAKGVALLLKSKPTAEDRNKAIALLQEAATKDEKASNLSDLAAALIATGDNANLARAVDVCNRALQINPRYAEALFNRAKALEFLGRQKETIDAYQRYLNVDSSSSWAQEAKRNIETQRQLL
ncbi:MAG TPA: zf-HC2 domain-containing protein [Thermoanaerobaculia bacterium]